MRCAILLLLAAAAPAGDGIEWAKDLDEAKAQSIKSGRPMLAYFTFDT
jgi:hypothetical protein